MDFYSKFVVLCNGVNKKPSRVAGEIGISKSMVSRWSSGGGISDSTAQKIADYFGISRSELLNDDQSQLPAMELLHENKQDHQTKYSQAAIEVAAAYEKASLELRNATRRILGLNEEPPAAKDKAM